MISGKMKNRKIKHKAAVFLQLERDVPKLKKLYKNLLNKPKIPIITKKMIINGKNWKLYKV